MNTRNTIKTAALKIFISKKRRITVKCKGWDLKAGSTVEASLIMPLILAVIFLLIFLTLFLYTRASFVRNGYIAALRASQAENEASKVRQRIARSEFDRLLRAGYTDSVSYQADFGGSGETISIHINLWQKLPRVIFAGNNLLPSSFSTDMTFRAKTCHPVNFIRTCRRLERWTGSVP